MARLVLAGAAALGGVVAHPQVVTQLVSHGGGHAQHADQVVLTEVGGQQRLRDCGRRPRLLTTLTPPERSVEHMDDWDAIPTMVPSKAPPLRETKQKSAEQTCG